MVKPRSWFDKLTTNGLTVKLSRLKLVAKTVFDDLLQLLKLDYRFSYFEERWITIGATKKSHILVVANLFFSDECEKIIRIISAGYADTKERTDYENH